MSGARRGAAPEGSPHVTEIRREQGQPYEPDEIDETLQPGPEHAAAEDVEEQDFATRNVLMSNAIPGGTSPAAGAVIGSGGQMAMEPETDEEEVDETVPDSAE